MANLVLTAENFAFGPIGKLLNLADLLKHQGHNMVFAGFGTSLQLAKNYNFDAVYEIDTDNPNSVNQLEAIIKPADMVISSMDLQSIVVAKRLGKLTVYIDCLFWFWETIPQPLFDIDLYVRERSIKDTRDSKNELEYGSIIKNLYSVGPILPEISSLKRKKQALVSYGGGEASYWYKVGRDTNYPALMTDILLKYVAWKDFDKVIITTSEHILKDLSTKFTNTPFEFTTCGSHTGFLKEMAQSELILTTTGLVTTQEAFLSKTPLIFLPPSNNSHYLLLDELREQGFASNSVHLSDFMPKLDLRGIPEGQSIPAVLQQIGNLERSPDVQAKIGESINKLIQTRKQWSTESINNNLKFVDSLGGNGSKLVVDKISQLLDE